MSVWEKQGEMGRAGRERKMERSKRNDGKRREELGREGRGKEQGREEERKRSKEVRKGRKEGGRKKGSELVDLCADGHGRWSILPFRAHWPDVQLCSLLPPLIVY